MYESDGTAGPVLNQRLANIQSRRERYVLSVQGRTFFVEGGSKEDIVLRNMVFLLCKQKPFEYSRDSRQSVTVTTTANSVKKPCIPFQTLYLADRLEEKN